VSGAERLRETAELFVKLAMDAGQALEFDDAGIRWAAWYVDGIRPVEREDQRRVQAALVGSFVGEALIATRGGEWVNDDGEWSLRLADGTRVHPFRQALKHITDGEDESILSLLAETGDETADDAPAADPAAALKETAEKFRAVIQNNGGPSEYGEAMVAFVDDFVENARGTMTEMADQYTALIGAVLGESLVAAYGGEWRDTGNAWVVRMPDDTAVWPFAAARKQLEGGAEDSILALFRQAAPGRARE
jgi:hypothetical protein